MDKSISHPHYGWNLCLLGWKILKIEIKKIKTHGRFGLVPNLSSPKSHVRDFWKIWKNMKGGLNWAPWAPLSQGYHKFCECPNPTKLGKFGGGLVEFGAHGDGTAKLHVHVAITTPHFYFYFSLPFLSSFSSSSPSSSFSITNGTHKNLARWGVPIHVTITPKLCIPSNDSE